MGTGFTKSFVGQFNQNLSVNVCDFSYILVDYQVFEYTLKNNVNKIIMLRLKVDYDTTQFQESTWRRRGQLLQRVTRLAETNRHCYDTDRLKANTPITIHCNLIDTLLFR